MREEMTDNQHGEFSEELLQYECEQAFLRERFEEPSAEEEWEVFRHRVGEAEERYRVWKRHVFRRAGLYGAVSVAAFLIGAVWFIHTGVLDKGNSLTLFTSTDAELFVTVEEQQENTGLGNTMVIVRDGKEVVKKGVVYSSKGADYTGHVVDKVRTSVVSIPCGQVYKIILHDGTEVWLNADSRLIFPTRFVGTNRVVRLEGEAYFKVAHNEKMPFVIETEKLVIQVLGTEFNMKTYKNSEAHVTLVDGSVKVQMPLIGKEIMLVPGEDIAYAEDDFQVKKVDTSYYTQWREGYFYFDDMYLSDILRDLGRWYNITIEMEQDSLLINQKLHFVADRSEDIDSVMGNLNAFEYLSASKKENKLTVRRKK